MAHSIRRTDDEIDGVLNAVADVQDSGSTKWPGMSYEQGVENALRWVLGEIDDNPMDD